MPNETKIWLDSPFIYLVPFIVAFISLLLGWKFGDNTVAVVNFLIFVSILSGIIWGAEKTNSEIQTKK